MKKIITLMLLTNVSMLFANSKDSLQYIFKPISFEKSVMDDCDACGCSASGGSMGFSSMLNPQFVGIRYFGQTYKSKSGIWNDSPWVNEHFNTLQIWGRIPISKKIQVTALVPYQFHFQDKPVGQNQISGLGDVTVIGNYTVYETISDSTKLGHKLQLGAGLKMPTGRYLDSNMGSVNPSFQVGTGSWDYLLVAEYVLKYQNSGLNIMLNYTAKTANKQQYQFGNQFNYGLTYFYLFPKGNYTFVPQIGIAGESYGSNKQRGESVRNTSGSIVLGKLGFELGYQKYSIGVSYQMPVSQNLSGGTVEAQQRIGLNLNYQL